MLTPRLQYLIEHYGKSLANRLSQETILASREIEMISSREVILTPRESVLKFSLSDPSRNKSATQWLITTYLNDGFRFEDLLGDNTSKVHNTLVQFGLYRGKLDASSRSLNQYKTLADVYASIEAFIPKDNEDSTLSGKALKRSEREKAHQETEFLHQGEDGFMIVSPKTQLASCWWGKGTQWCTASDNNNMFQHYNKEAPLLIIVMPNGDKLQLHIGENIQFMNAQDQDVEESYIAEHWEVLKDIMFASVKQNGMALRYIPKQRRDKELCWSAVRKTGWALKFVPDDLRDKEICLEAVKQNGVALGYVPEKLRDYELCLEAVRQDGVALGYVTEQFRDRELCLEAVKQDGRALDYVPDELRDICSKIIEGNIKDWSKPLIELKSILSEEINIAPR